MGVPTTPWGAVTCARALQGFVSSFRLFGPNCRGGERPWKASELLVSTTESWGALPCPEGLTQPGAASRCVVQLQGVLSLGKGEDGWSRVMGEPGAGQDTGGDSRGEG